MYIDLREIWQVGGHQCRAAETADFFAPETFLMRLPV